MKYDGKISFTIDKEHPDYVENYEGLTFTFEETYSFNDDYTEEEAVAFIKRDLSLVAGGGYNTDHIHNVTFETERI